jgi:hypothetical protein
MQRISKEDNSLVFCLVCLANFGEVLTLEFGDLVSKQGQMTME